MKALKAWVLVMGTDLRRYLKGYLLINVSSQGNVVVLECSYDGLKLMGDTGQI